MMNFGKKLLEVLFFRSPAQAANPNVVPQPPDDPIASSVQGQGETIDSFFDMDSLGPLKMGKSECSGKDAFGALVRGKTTHHIQLACNHLVSQVQPEQTETRQVPGVAGPCHYCQLEIQLDQQRRFAAGAALLLPDDAVRLTLVCTQCARMSVSGNLCCPRHSRIVDDGSVNMICLDVEELESQTKKASVMKIIAPLLGLFTDDADELGDQRTRGYHQQNAVKPDDDKAVE